MTSNTPAVRAGLVAALSAAAFAGPALAQMGGDDMNHDMNHEGHGGRPLTATLTGAAEVPGPGDADGRGTFSATVNPGKGEVCYRLSVSMIDAASAAHIHKGAAGVAGPVSVALQAPAGGSSNGCVAVSRELAMALVQSPGDYYVNVHNAAFASGAVRGQLGK
jgi:CHRD domain